LLNSEKLETGLCLKYAAGKFHDLAPGTPMSFCVRELIVEEAQYNFIFHFIIPVNDL